jgi:hypothetical protein
MISKLRLLGILKVGLNQSKRCTALLLYIYIMSTSHTQRRHLTTLHPTIANFSIEGAPSFDFATRLHIIAITSR